jgi:hypothetical protein
MKLRFIEYKGDLYLSVGITYDNEAIQECFIAIPIDSIKPNLLRSVLENNTIKIPFSQAKEITNKSQLIALLVLYGW